jgi:hypothetical protein
MPMRASVNLFSRTPMAFEPESGALRTAQRPASLFAMNSFLTSEVLRADAAKRTPTRLFVK